MSFDRRGSIADVGWKLGPKLAPSAAGGKLKLFDDTARAAGIGRLFLAQWRMEAGVMAIVGRSEELAAIERLLDRGRGILLLEGEAGIGKTTLWREGVLLAEGRSLPVIAAQPVGAETDLSFAALRDLLDPIFDEVSDELPPPQRAALAVALFREQAEGRPPQAGAVAAGALSALRAWARREPLVLAVDDVQALDPASARTLAYALRRLEAEPVAALLTQRREAETSSRLLEGIAPEQLTVCPLGPLSLGALSRLLQDRLGASFPRWTLRKLHEAAGGTRSTRSSSPVLSRRAAARFPPAIRCACGEACATSSAAA